MSFQRFPRRTRRDGAGFTLVELLVVMAMMTVFAVVFFGVFNFNVDVSEVQGQIADMHQNLRVAQHDITRFSRMAGRGGLPVVLAGGSLPNGVAISVQNNVPMGTTIGAAGTPQVLVGTDVLTVRGVFESPVYQLKTAPGDLASRTLQVNFLSPKGAEQDLSSLAEAVERVNSGDPADPVVAVSPLGQYSIFALTGGTVQRQDDLNQQSPLIGVELQLSDDPDYLALLVAGGANPADMTTVSSLGIIEEYRYYIRSVQPVPGRVIPRLSRARFYPGTETVHPSDPTAAEDIADHIVDLQIALGVDRFGGGGGGPADGEIYEGEDDADADEWLYNHPDDAAAAGQGSLEFVRMTLMARTSRADRRWAEVPLIRLEDHRYDDPAAVSPAATDPLRRRRIAQSVVNLRNM